MKQMIEIKNVTKRYGSFAAIENISFTVDEASIHGLIGYNGAGKTTLIKTIAGIYKPDEGKTLLDGENSFNSNEARRRLFYVPDDLFFPVGATMNSMAKFYADYYPDFSGVTFERIAKIFSLDTSAKIRGFSKGMQRQAEIALALSSHPKFMLLDECLDGLDIAKKDICKQLFMDYMAESGCSLIIASHALGDLENLCDHIALIGGKHMQMNCCVDDIGDENRKFRLVFKEKIEKNLFGGIHARKLLIEGSTAVVTVSGGIDAARRKLQSLNPEFMDEFPLSLEEVFLQETEDLGDEISKVFKE